MEGRGSILVLMGIPASGKTTIAKQLESSAAGFAHTYRITYDEIVALSMQARIVQSGEEKLWKNVRTSILDTVRRSVLEVFEPYDEESYCWISSTAVVVDKELSDRLSKLGKELQEFLRKAKTEKEDFVIIVDDNMYYSSMRYEYFKIARLVGWGFCQLYLHCSVDVAKWNNSRRERPVAEEVYDMIRWLELPKPCDRAWEHYSVILMCNKGIFLPLLEDSATFLKALKQGLLRGISTAETLSSSEMPPIEDAVITGNKSDSVGQEGSESDDGLTEKMSRVTFNDEEDSNYYAGAVYDPYMEFCFDAQQPQVKKEMMDGIKWLISMAFTHPFKPQVNMKLEEVIAARNACERSVLHQLDKILRKVVSYQIKSIRKSYCKEDTQKLAEIYASSRRNIFEKLRAGSLHIPQHFSIAIKDKRMTDSVVQDIENYLKNLFYADVTGKVAMYNYPPDTC